MPLNIDVADYIGIGFGPANLALAITISEEWNGAKGIFFDSKLDFAWHNDMLIGDVSLQVPFLKDLATLRNPCSSFSFLNYLREQDRLEHFVNLRCFYPTRIEYQDYLRWAASKFSEIVEYGKKVVKITPVQNSENEKILQVVTLDLRTNEEETYLTRNIILAPGGSPTFPNTVQNDSARIIHSSRYLSGISAAFSDRSLPYKFAIVGSGQSSGEITENLLATYPNAKVELIIRDFALRPIDDSPFVNEIFLSKSRELFYEGQDSFRQDLLDKVYNTNYAVVDIDVLKRLYNFSYQERVNNTNRLNIRSFTQLESAREVEGRVHTVLKNLKDDKSEIEAYDGLILGMGYRRELQHSMIEDLIPYLQFEPERSSVPMISKDYRLVTTSELNAGIFVQGLSENKHGISDTLLSLLSIRSKEICDSMKKNTNKFVEVYL